jgi:hypothetical protein
MGASRSLAKCTQRGWQPESPVVLARAAARMRVSMIATMFQEKRVLPPARVSFAASTKPPKRPTSRMTLFRSAVSKMLFCECTIGIAVPAGQPAKYASQKLHRGSSSLVRKA